MQATNNDKQQSRPSLDPSLSEEDRHNLASFIQAGAKTITMDKDLATSVDIQSTGLMLVKKIIELSEELDSLRKELGELKAESKESEGGDPDA